MKKQMFMNKFTTTVSKNEVIKMFNEGKLTNKDLLVCEFLFNNRFATLYQINAMLKANGHTDLQSQRAFKLSQNRIINRFVMAEDGEEVDFNDDGKVVYCLDIGGKYLLTHYSTVDTTEWLTSNNMMSQDIIENVLMANEVYVKLLSTVKDKLVTFGILEERRVGKQSTTIDFDFGIQSGETVKYYIGNFVRENDMPKNFQNKAVKLESLISTNGWKKYYFGGETAPACFFIGQDDAFALNIATQINECYAFSGKDRYSSFARLMEKNLYDRDTFLKYENNGIEKSFKSSKIASFVPEEK